MELLSGKKVAVSPGLGSGPGRSAPSSGARPGGRPRVALFSVRSETGRMTPRNWEDNRTCHRGKRKGASSRPLPRHRLGSLLAFALTLAGCGWGGKSAGEQSARSAEEVLHAHSDSLFTVSGVRGTGVTDWRGEEVIIVIVEDRSTAALDRIPQRLEGYRVIVLDEPEIRRLGGL